MKTLKCTCVLHMNISQYNDLVPIDVTDSARVNALTLHKTDCWPPSPEWIYRKILNKRSNVRQCCVYHCKFFCEEKSDKGIISRTGRLKVRIRTWSISSAVSRRAGGPSRRHVGCREYFVSDVLVANFLGDSWVRRVSERGESKVERK